jgi:type I restriction enzyme R subunit
VIKGNVSIDWMHRESARANIRRHVKRLLRKYGYAPDLQDAAAQNVLQQAEALSRNGRRKFYSCLRPRGRAI